MTEMLSRRVLDTPGLVNCGIGGRRRRTAHAMAVTAQRVAWHRWAGGLVLSIITKFSVAEVIAHWPR